MSEANVKANRMVSTKWTYHKRSLAINYLLLYFFENFEKKSWFDVPATQMPMFVLLALEFYLAVLFPFEYP